jgi:hypothetical protein
MLGNIQEFMSNQQNAGVIPISINLEVDGKKVSDGDEINIKAKISSDPNADSSRVVSFDNRKGRASR